MNLLRKVITSKPIIQGKRMHTRTTRKMHAARQSPPAHKKGTYESTQTALPFNKSSSLLMSLLVGVSLFSPQVTEVLISGLLLGDGSILEPVTVFPVMKVNSHTSLYLCRHK